ncbi:MAG TPA: sigma-70 family RNA polymerase sigma factor [Thermoleophilaceae bacterium]|nr:sigma-70 family RNA polymerase sigma factor [Thermoleophilaceae bacterium]
MEASALQHGAVVPALGGRSPLLRLQGDERLVALTRKGNQAAFEALVQRYESRLLAFCRHMLGSREDAEDVLQEVFAAAYNAMLADERPINARPWLYRIARNRCLNHLRRPVPVGQDSMDIFERDGGQSTSDTVHKREEFRQIVSDVQDLPETQRTALLLREIDALSYDQIAEAMETTIPSVKSLLVRARVSLAEAAEARLLTCEEVRIELGKAAEGLERTSAPVRRHLRTCERCRTFRGELRKTTKALAMIYPLGPLVVLKKLVFGKLIFGGGSAAGSSGGAAGAGAVGASAVGGASAIGSTAAIGSSAAMGGASLASTAVATTAAMGGSSFAAGAATTAASKAAATIAAAAIATAGVVEVKHAAQPLPVPKPVVAAAPVAKPAPASKPQPLSAPEEHKAVTQAVTKDSAADPKTDATATTTPIPVPVPVGDTGTTTTPAPATEEGSGTATLPPQHQTSGGQTAPDQQYGDAPSPPPGEPAGTEPAPTPAPTAGEPTSGSGTTTTQDPSSPPPGS